jgi:tetraacyldisaccharide 4'-kinase
VKFWYRRGAIAWLLWPVSIVFLLGVLVRRLLYALRVLPSAHPGIPVIVVGNLTVGGTGKTPLVIWIAQFLRARGWNPAIISRGYGANVTEPRAATISSTAEEVGDEPIVIARRAGCPVWVGPDRVRVAAALRAQQAEVDVLVLDDGLQHYAIRRDLEIALVDARGFGNGFLLPAGPLREPKSRLRSVDAVVSQLKLKGDTAHRMTDARERAPLATFKRVHAVAGIGDPERFFAHLRQAGAEVIAHPFPDHHRFVPQELEFGDELPVLLTEKDAVKLRGAARPQWWVLPVSAEPDPAFGAWLAQQLDDWRRSKAA